MKHTISTIQIQYDKLLGSYVWRYYEGTSLVVQFIPKKLAHKVLKNLNNTLA